MTYRIETCVLSNERLWQQDGGEPIVYVVFDHHDAVFHIALSEYDADEWLEANIASLPSGVDATLPPITADMMALDYLTEVRANGEWAIGNVARCDDGHMFEVVYEVLETAERRRADAMRAYTDHGDLGDKAWDMAEIAARFAVQVCRTEHPAALTNPKEEP
jgi:hypothetical protein